MRRKVGIAGIQQRRNQQANYQAVGQELSQDKLEHLAQSMGKFKSNLEEFALKHKSDIQKDPEFRAQFHSMCANIGVDPLVSNKGIFAQLLGFGDFYYKLGVQCVEACLATRSANGGMMDMDALLKYVTRRRGKTAEPVSKDDIQRAIQCLKVLGGGFTTIRVGGRKYLRSVPGELNYDLNQVIDVAQEQGYISEGQVVSQLKWTPERAQKTLQKLLQDGIAWIDHQGPNGQVLYWFPCTGDKQL